MGVLVFVAKIHGLGRVGKDYRYAESGIRSFELGVIFTNNRRASCRLCQLGNVTEVSHP